MTIGQVGAIAFTLSESRRTGKRHQVVLIGFGPTGDGVRKDTGDQTKSQAVQARDECALDDFVGYLTKEQGGKVARR